MTISYKIIKFQNADHSMTQNESNDFSYWSKTYPEYFNTINSWLNQFQ